MGSAGTNGSGEIRYANSGGVNVAYRVLGTGPVDLVYIGGWVTHLEVWEEDPAIARFVHSIARFARMVDFDKRGTGLSDRVSEDQMPTMEERMDDIRAVMDAVGLERASIFGFSEGGALAMLFAATYPERTERLVLWGTYPTMVRRPDYQWGMTQEQLEASVAAFRERWGTGVGLGPFVPDRAHDPAMRRWWGRFQRMAASPAAAVALLRMNAAIDIRGALSAISAPTLILHRRGDLVAPFGHAEYLADHIADSRLVALDGSAHWPWVGEDAEEISAETEEFLTGTRGAPEPERALATILFTDIVGSTERAADVGDARWRELLQRHDAMVRAELGRHRGREIKTVGDGFLATFDGPARAIRCALAILEQARGLGLDLRAGIHTGECELLGDDIGGIGVHIGARVAALAQPSEVLVSRTVTDLVAGSGIEFEPRGEQPLKGVPGEWALFSVAA